VPEILVPDSPRLVVPDGPRVVYTASPFRCTDRIELGVPEGSSISEILARAKVREDAHVTVDVDGQRVEPRDWHHVRPRAHSVVCVRAIPESQPGESGGKTALRIVALIVILVVAIYLGPVAAGALGYGAGTTGAAVIGAAVTGAIAIGGQLAVNALIPPPKLRPPDTPSGRIQNAITGSRNVVNQWGVVPRVFGTWKIFPCQATLPFQEIKANKVYFRQLFDCGQGPVDFAEPSIGNTPLLANVAVQYTGKMTTPAIHRGDRVKFCVLADVNTVTAEVTLVHRALAVDLKYTSASGKVVKRESVPFGLPNVTGTWSWMAAGGPTPDFVLDGDFRGVEIEFRRGRDDDEPITLIDQEVHQTPLSIQLRGPIELVPSSVVYNQAGAPFNPGLHIVPAKLGDFYPETRRSLVDATALSVDVQWPLGVGYRRDSGEISDWIVRVQVEYRKVGENDWQKAPESPMKVETANNKPIVRSMRWEVAKGQYDVRLTRQTPAPGDDGITDLTLWIMLRTHRVLDLSNLQGHALVAIAILASNQLTGVIDALNLKVTSRIPKWNGSAWVEAPTGNPAAVFREILQAADNHLPASDDEIDLERLQRWSVNCDTNKLTFNGAFDDVGTVKARLELVAACGLASRTVRDGKHSVVEDLDQDTPAGWFGPRNSWNASVTRVFPDVPHALRVRWQDPALDYKWHEEPVYADGYSLDGAGSTDVATIFEVMEFPGVDNGLQAYVLGRYNLAVLRDRANVWSIDCDPEGTLVCERGDLVRLQQDFIQSTVATGRVQVVATNIGGDATSVFVDQVCVMESGPTYGLRIRHDDLTEEVQVLVAVVGKNKELTFATPVPVAELKIKPDDLWFFGVFGSETKAMLVKEILPTAQMNARLTLLDDAPTVRTSYTGGVPAWASGELIAGEVPPNTRVPEDEPPAGPDVGGTPGSEVTEHATPAAITDGPAPSANSGAAKPSTPRIRVRVRRRGGKKKH
jgi:hypothetical protein